jgi:hypothetical protein
MDHPIPLCPNHLSPWVVPTSSLFAATPLFKLRIFFNGFNATKIDADKKLKQDPDQLGFDWVKLQLPTTTAPDNSNANSMRYKTPGELYDEVMDGYIKELQDAYAKGSDALREKFLDLALGRQGTADPSKTPPLALDDLSLRDYMLRSVKDGGKGAGLRHCECHKMLWLGYLQGV